MSSVRRVGRRAVTAVAGRRRWQPFFDALHTAALIGRGYGEGDFVRSGELQALEAMAQGAPPGCVVIDVGANVGGWALEAARLIGTATVYAFEPAPDVHAQLVQRCRGTGVQPVAQALSSAVGTAALHRFRGFTGLSSLEGRDLTEMGIEARDTVTVPTTTVDVFCASHGIEGLHILKVDAEGHDLSVLDGAGAMLSEGLIHFVQFEFGGANIDSRTFLRDFKTVLGPRYELARVLRDGLVSLGPAERDEVFVTANYVARLRAPGRA